MEFIKEYVRYAHTHELKHMGSVSTVMGQVHQRFHVVGLKNLATETIRNCFPCAKKGWEPLTLPAPLFHATRLGNQVVPRAFTEIGIDHMGPFQLRQGRSTVEGYVLVIACCATRAINLEMSLSTGATHVLAALQ